MNRKEVETIFLKLKDLPSQLIESESIEFKNYRDENSLYNDKDLSNEVSALANKNGGLIIIGVIDVSTKNPNQIKAQLCGFKCLDSTEALERLQGKIKPKIDIKIFEIRFEEKTYTIFEVPKITHSLVTTSSGKVYIREGKSSRPMEPYEIEEAVKKLQSYDWSAEEIQGIDDSVFDLVAINNALRDYCNRREINKDISQNEFLEAINCTKNGVITKTGVLMFGKKLEIEKYCGEYEYRFTYKTKAGDLIVNEIWSDNIWNSIIFMKKKFKEYNKSINIVFKEKKYSFPALDEKAFHEALLNSIVHRDYSINGMTSVVFTEDCILMTNPGSFYGGIDEDNIIYHEPRHRNKELAKCLMLFNMVDRAGMGILRMGIGSLIYGRSFPIFKQKLDAIEIKMDVEYCNPAIFVVTVKHIKELSLIELVIFNIIINNGCISYFDLEKEIGKLTEKPWNEIKKAVEQGVLKKYIEFVGDNKDIYVRISDLYYDFFDCKSKISVPTNSDKYVKIFRYLNDHTFATNDDFSSELNLKNGSYLSKLLNKIEYIRKEGKTTRTKWFISY